MFVHSVLSVAAPSVRFHQSHTFLTQGSFVCIRGKGGEVAFGSTHQTPDATKVVTATLLTRFHNDPRTTSIATKRKLNTGRSGTKREV